MKRSVLMVVVLVVGCTCCVCYAKDPQSPLFRARLEATMRDWENGGSPGAYGGDDPPLTPASLNPASFCLGSACLASYCIGSLCISSECVGSGCAGSTCIGSGCAASMCAASGCIGSICGGSACMGTTLCPKVCGDDTGPASTQGPDYGNLTYTWGPCRGL